MTATVHMLATLLLGGCLSGSPCDSSPCGPDAECQELGGGDYECACADTDADGLCGQDDNCSLVSNPDQADFNSDGLGDACDEIVIPLAELSTTASFFEYQALETTVFYFAVVDADGLPHVAIDACDLCYQQRRGYRQEGDEMVCNNCGKDFSIDELGDDSGDCNPGIVLFQTTESEIIIEPELLEDASGYFN